MSIWRIESSRESAEAFHGRDLPAERAIWRATINDTAVVLGSRQDSNIVNHEACQKDGVAIVRRRSGGGVVLLQAGTHLWLDFVVPQGDELWRDDIGESMWWVGDLWAEALAKCEVADLDQLKVHRGGLERSSESDLICFGGLGPGEVTLHGQKIVGISQRRNREMARFQCVVHKAWSPNLYRKYLLVDQEISRLAVAEVSGLDLLAQTVIDLAATR